jgi:predicted HD phosphohydrolase
VEVNFLGRQRSLGKQVFVLVQHALSQMKSSMQCSACLEDVGATVHYFVTACLTDDLMSLLAEFDSLQMRTSYHQMLRWQVAGVCMARFITSER